MLMTVQPLDDDLRNSGRWVHERTGERETPSPSSGDKERNIQEHADKLLAQASEIGLNVFTKASLFWKEGKERVQKAYEARAVSSSGDVDAGIVCFRR